MLEKMQNKRGNLSSPTRRGFWKLVASAFGFGAIICSWWSCIIFVSLAGKPLVISTHIDGYRPTTFIIEKLIFDRGDHEAKRIYAKGTVDEQPEEFNLGAYLKEKPTSQYELEQLLAVGQQLEVFYNREVSDPVAARVLFPTENFKEYWLKQLTHVLRIAYLPLGIAIGFSLLASLIGRSWIGVRFAAGSMFFPVFSWVAVYIFGW